MRLHLLSAYAVHPGLDTLLAAALLDTEKSHSLCETASHADAIVFIENTQFDDVMFKQLREHELVRQFPGKVFMYNEMDRPWDVLPGLYTCIARKHHDTLRQRSFAYLSTPNQYVRNIFYENTERRWLYSFMGAMSHPCRRNIMKLPQDQGFLTDTSEFNVWNTSAQQMDMRAKEYTDVLGASKFVLCPRGLGTSSIRLYETLEAGRVPVIISDQWVPPAETDWSFAVQVRQNAISSLPGLLGKLESEALERGDAARQAWLEHYSPGTLFNTLGNAVQSLDVNGNEITNQRSVVPWNKWLASSGLFTRTAVQRLRGRR